MPFNRPTLATLITRIQQDIAAQLPGTDPTLRRSLLNILGQMLAGAIHGNYGNLAWLAEQIPPDTADSPLMLRWAAMFKITPKSAAAATGQVTVTGAPDGMDIPIGTVLQRGDGAQFASTVDVQIAGGTANVSIAASLPGSAGNTAANAILTFIAPIAGVNPTGSVTAAGLTGGVDTESDDSVLDRFLQRLQNPPQGGASADYIAWTLAQPGVTRVWVFPNQLGIGTITILFVNDNANPIFPTGPECATVLTALQLLCPVTASPNLTVIAPTAQAYNYSMHLVPTTNTSVATAQANVEAALSALHQANGAPGQALLLSDIEEAIKTAGGIADFSTLLITGGAAPPAAIVNNLPVPGTFIWT